MTMHSQSLWTLAGHRNVAVYAPGRVVDAMPGCPTYPDRWACAYWWPGEPEEVTLHPTLALALAEVRGRDAGRAEWDKGKFYDAVRAFLTNHYPQRYATEPRPFYCRACVERRRREGKE